MHKVKRIGVFSFAITQAFFFLLIGLFLGVFFGLIGGDILNTIFEIVATVKNQTSAMLAKIPLLLRDVASQHYTQSRGTKFPQETSE